jgi:hypothetical protein
VIRGGEELGSRSQRESLVDEMPRVNFSPERWDLYAWVKVLATLFTWSQCTYSYLTLKTPILTT